METSAKSSIGHKSIPVKELCLHRAWYTVNREYQRDEDIWSGEDKKYLIDSILKGFDIPKIYLRQLQNNTFEIVDGQQRLDTVWKFRDDKITLSGDISGRELDGKEFSNLPSAVAEKFLDYEFDTVILNEFDDERVIEMFMRLQRGKPLNPAERLNAYPGEIVPAMRELGNHVFFRRVNFSLRRYHSYLIAARMIALQYGLQHYDALGDIGPNRLYNFFTEHKNMGMDSVECQAVKQNLDLLANIFPSQKQELSSEVWVINLYMLVAHLRRHYAIKDKVANIASFYSSFWGEAEALREMSAEPRTYKITNDFVLANSSGTGDKDRLESRMKELVTNFIDRTPELELLDPNRYFNQYENIVIYNRGNGVCAECHQPVLWKDYEADHVKPWALGGKTTLDNAQLLCREHNRAKGAKS
jgi:hypothetical protein